MNKIIVLFVKSQEDGKVKMLKWNNEEEFSMALKTGIGIPEMNDIITEAWITDNLVDIGNTFEVTLNKLKLVLDI